MNTIKEFPRGPENSLEDLALLLLRAWVSIRGWGTRIPTVAQHSQTHTRTHPNQKQTLKFLGKC